MQKCFLFVFLVCSTYLNAQEIVNISRYDKKGEAKIERTGKLLTITWPAGKAEHGKLLLDFEKGNPLFKSMELGSRGKFKKIAGNLDGN